MTRAVTLPSSKSSEGACQANMLNPPPPPGGGGGGGAKKNHGTICDYDASQPALDGHR